MLLKNRILIKKMFYYFSAIVYYILIWQIYAKKLFRLFGKIYFILNSNILNFKQYGIYGGNNIYNSLLQKVVEK